MFFFDSNQLTLASESRLAGSAGNVTSTVRVSTAITPTGIPPSLARPVTTVCAQGFIISDQLPLSKNPLSHSPGFVGFGLPANMHLGSYGDFVGIKPIGRSIGSFGITIGNSASILSGIYDNQCMIV